MDRRCELQDHFGLARRGPREGDRNGHGSGLRVLELFCGIGGCAAALEGRARVVAALDISRLALGVYARNFPHPVHVRNLDSLRAGELAAFGADLWWMSPPCQPFTRRGLGRDEGDPRARPLLRLIDRIAEARPPYVALENVPGFAGSRTRQRLLETLEDAGYEVRERLLCPTELGWPNRRRRYYLVAGGRGLAPARETAATPVGAAGRSRNARPAGLAAFLDSQPSPALEVPPALLERYRGALDLVAAEDPAAVTACFTSAYGRSPVRSGSYLHEPLRVRRFSPAEILRFLGFPPAYSLPPDLPLAKAWPLVGASLSVPAVQEVLAAVPELGQGERPSHSRRDREAVERAS